MYSCRNDAGAPKQRAAYYSLKHHWKCTFRLNFKYCRVANSLSTRSVVISGLFNSWLAMSQVDPRYWPNFLLVSEINRKATYLNEIVMALQNCNIAKIHKSKTNATIKWFYINPYFVIR